jgi:hypothetical protein
MQSHSSTWRNLYHYACSLDAGQFANYVPGDYPRQDEAIGESDSQNLEVPIPLS